MGNDNCIYLNDIFNLTDKEIDNCKISLSISEGKNGQLCIDSWLRDETNLSSGFWPYYGIQTNFKVGQYCLCFYRMGYYGDYYLFVGSGKITEIPKKEDNLPAKYTPIERLQKYVGRLVIKVSKGNTMGRYNFNLRKYLNECEVAEIKVNKYSGNKFPGYKNMILSYEELEKAIYLYRGWEGCLNNKKGIYAIVDKAPENEYSGLGRIYIGKASGENGMLYQRWKNYADNLTGGNKELERVKKLKGEDYIKKYFQWSLLEDFDESYSDDKILERENHWKQVFNSRKEGLNDN